MSNRRLPSPYSGLRVDEYSPLWQGVGRTLFRLSNYRTRMEIGADPELQAQDIDWEAIMGHEYLLFEQVNQCLVKLLEPKSNGA